VYVYQLIKLVFSNVNDAPGSTYVANSRTLPNSEIVLAVISMFLHMNDANARSIIDTSSSTSITTKFSDGSVVHFGETTRGESYMEIDINGETKCKTLQS
jgi:hypothetical protein